MVGERGRNASGRRSLDSHATERKSAFRNARQLFEGGPSDGRGSPGNQAHKMNERGDEKYGNIIYTTNSLSSVSSGAPPYTETYNEADEFEDEGAKSINDLIKNFESLSGGLRDRGRNFGSARVSRSASPVKWRRRSAPPAASSPDESQPPTIPAEPPRRQRGRPSVEYSEMETPDSHEKLSNLLGDENQLNATSSATTQPNSASSSAFHHQHHSSHPNNANSSNHVTENHYQNGQPHHSSGLSGNSQNSSLNLSNIQNNSSNLESHHLETPNDNLPTNRNYSVPYNDKLPHSFTESIPPEEPLEVPATRTRIKWSDEPILVGETYHQEDYQRGNPDLDPVAESAVFELEKRLDKMDKFDLTLEKDSNGYGLTIIGMGIGADSGVERLGIYVKKVFDDQAAERAGIQMADQIVEVDGISLVGVSHNFAAETLRSTGQTVQFLMARDRIQEESEVRQLILKTLDDETRHSQVPSSPEPEDSDDDPNKTFDVNEGESAMYNETIRTMQEAQTRLLQELSVRDNEIREMREKHAKLEEKHKTLEEELQRQILRNRKLEERNREVEEQLYQSHSTQQKPRSWNSVNTFDELDELEESKVDDTNVVSLWSGDEVLKWLSDNNLDSLISTFRLHNIDGKELERIRTKNDSKTLKSYGIEKENRARLRTALRSLANAC